uniref:Uncharacterized protein n=1 Tax=Rhizophora mucronata TaxID=61149 RepID=A0A2P2NX39_RHIMU
MGLSFCCCNVNSCKSSCFSSFVCFVGWME